MGLFEWLRRDGSGPGSRAASKALPLLHPKVVASPYAKRIPQNPPKASAEDPISFALALPSLVTVAYMRAHNNPGWKDMGEKLLSAVCTNGYKDLWLSRIEAFSMQHKETGLVTETVEFRRVTDRVTAALSNNTDPQLQAVGHDLIELFNTVRHQASLDIGLRSKDIKPSGRVRDTIKEYRLAGTGLRVRGRSGLLNDRETAVLLKMATTIADIMERHASRVDGEHKKIRLNMPAIYLLQADWAIKALSSFPNSQLTIPLIHPLNEFFTQAIHTNKPRFSEELSRLSDAGMTRQVTVPIDGTLPSTS